MLQQLDEETRREEDARELAGAQQRELQKELQRELRAVARLELSLQVYVCVCMCVRAGCTCA